MANSSFTLVLILISVFSHSISTVHASHRNLRRLGAIDLPPSPLPSPSQAHHHKHHRHHVRTWSVGFVSGALIGVISACLFVLFYRFLRNVIRGHYRNPNQPLIFSSIIKNADELSFLKDDELLRSLEVIGRGGCGEVYKAQLPSDPERVLAIKRIKKGPMLGQLTEDESHMLDKWMKQIRSEILTVGHIRHRNLLPLLAHVARPDSHFLVYEYMKNGSLHDTIKRECLDWPARLKIARGIAAGLEYLHINHKPHIIHRDLKPANILIDDDMEARIADFGFAKEIPDSQTHMTSSNVAGTYGYIAPEYHQTLKFTAKCDIYSFGVILAVLVTGKLPSDDFFQETDEVSLVKWLINVMSSGNAREAIDSTLMGNGFEDQMLLMLRIACFCTVGNPKDRPNSKEVRLMLSQIQ